MLQIIQGETIRLERTFAVNSPVVFNNCTFLIKPPAAIHIEQESRFTKPNIVFVGCRFKLVEDSSWQAANANWYSPIKIVTANVLFSRCSFENMKLPPKGSIITASANYLMRNFGLNLRLDFEACSFNNVSTGKLITVNDHTELNLQNVLVDNSTIHQGLINPNGYIDLKLSGDGTTIRNSRLLFDSNEWFTFEGALNVTMDSQSQLDSIRIERSYIRKLSFYAINTWFTKQFNISDSYILEAELPDKTASVTTVYNSCICRLLTKQPILQIKPNDLISQDYGVRFHNCLIINQKELTDGTD